MKKHSIIIELPLHLQLAVNRAAIECHVTHQVDIEVNIGTNTPDGKRFNLILQSDDPLAFFKFGLELGLRYTQTT